MENVAEWPLLFQEFVSERDKWDRPDALTWSEEWHAWLVTRYEEAALVLKDDDLFTREDRYRDGGTEFWRHGIPVAAGETHRKLHSLHLRLTGKKFAEDIREQVIQRVALELMEPVVERGYGDLDTDFAFKFPMLVGCEYLGFDINDRSFMDKIVLLNETREAWKTELLSGTGCPLGSEVAVRGVAAVNGLADLFLPTIRARKVEPKDDLISELWRVGPTVFDAWDEQFMVGACWSNFAGGEVKLMLRNFFYMIATNESLQATLRHDRSLVPGFVEEGLRFVGPVRWLTKHATADTELGGRSIRAGDGVYVSTAAANRDSALWPSPDDYDLERPNSGAHVSFGQGPRYCVGRFLARTEMVEAVDMLLKLTNHIELDSAKTPPSWGGGHTRSVMPINVLVS